MGNAARCEVLPLYRTSNLSKTFLNRQLEGVDPGLEDVHTRCHVRLLSNLPAPENESNLYVVCCIICAGNVVSDAMYSYGNRP
jgi:hypothetical protein